jgi:hypothetical protein
MHSSGCTLLLVQQLLVVHSIVHWSILSQLWLAQPRGVQGHLLLCICHTNVVRSSTAAFAKFVAV